MARATTATNHGENEHRYFFDITVTHALYAPVRPAAPGGKQLMHSSAGVIMEHMSVTF